MLTVLRQIVEEVNRAPNLEQALRIIVRRVKQAMEVDLCSIYLTDYPSRQHVLMATEGLNPDSVGQVRLGFDEGLVGLVGQRNEPVNIDDAPSHPRYRFCPGSGEEQYHGFLGVPIIHHRKLLGILVVQRRLPKRFEEADLSFMVTIAAQLAGGIAHAEASGGIGGLRRDPGLSAVPENRPLQGLAGAPGVGMGTVVVVYPTADLGAIPDRRATDPDLELRAFRCAVEAVKQDIRRLSSRLGERLPAEEMALFDAYLMLLDSDSLNDRVVERIREGNWVQAALRDTIEEHVRIFREMDDPYLSERSDDIRDLGLRILAYLQENPPARPDYPQRVVLVANEITATMLAEVPAERLVGIVSARGSRSSHIAILCRAMGIPAVMGANNLPVNRIDGLEIIADGYTGRVYLSPSPEVRAEYTRLLQEETELLSNLSHLRELPAETADGFRIPLYINTGLIADIEPSQCSGAEGIGLYRTEFPFMAAEQFPGEEQQLQIYRKVLKSFAPQPVILRTLDVGGDKSLPYFPIEEDNPFLGWRGIRITLDHPEIFLVQLRAMLRANHGLGNLRLLLPMISSVSEVEEAMRLIDRACEELSEECGERVARPPAGVMVEVPAAVYQAEALAARVDFLSIGSNDLTQYLLAVDRNNARVAELFDSLHPAVLRALEQVVVSGHRHHREVSVCGEMAGDPAAAVLLLGMGIDSLSMTVSGLPRIKWVIRSFTRQEATRLLREVLEMEDVQQIRQHMATALERAGLGGLIRAGKY
ncbi:MAG TPA: phosphoenolpyruvate--protein phosphotransferase [Gammaproteobacteria bacterium]|nr:phosphoenolpyruvate--protein phosphotransferase [Gammaproteobacteria bacterium]